MNSRSVGSLIIASALGARAFLIPNGLIAASDDVSLYNLNPKHQTVELPCSSCAFTSSGLTPKDQDKNAVDSGLLWAQGQANNLMLEFIVSDDQLLLNGRPVYPFHLDDSVTEPLVALQIPSSRSSETVDCIPLEVTASSITVEEHTASENGDLVIPLVFRIMELERQSMTLDDVTVRLLRMSDGDLLILDTTKTPNPEAQSVPITLESTGFHLDLLDPKGPDMSAVAPSTSSELSAIPECNGLPTGLCKLKTMVEAKIAQVKQGKIHCMGSKQGRPGRLSAFQTIDQINSGPHRHGRPHHDRPHHFHHHHRHHRHHLLHAFARGVATVLVPTIAGVMVGMAVSLIGLALGRMITFLWFNIVRGGRRGYDRISSDDSGLGDGYCDEKVLVIEDTEPLPLYEEAPAYEETITEQR